MNLPNITLVASELGLTPKHRYTTEWYYDCPFCNDTHAHLCIDLQKQVWRCPKCGAGGGIVGLVEQYLRISHRDAILKIARMDFSNVPIPKTTVIKRPASPKTIDRTYRTLLSLLTLKKEDCNDLLARGLSLAAIKKLNIKSTPPDKDVAITTKLIAMGCSLENVPGFYQDRSGTWHIQCSLQGYFVPSVHGNKILYMQVRARSKTSKFRYWSFSSKNRNGISSHSEAHEIAFHRYNVHDVWWTEGALKADVASYLMYQRCHIAVPFVAFDGAAVSQKKLDSEMQRLKRIGVSVIHEALDMDKAGNNTVVKKAEVAAAEKQVLAAAKRAGLQVVIEKWPVEKGIDDYLKRLNIKKTA